MCHFFISGVLNETIPFNEPPAILIDEYVTNKQVVVLCNLKCGPNQLGCNLK